ncbi:MAG: GNAT family N-acetyltransferase [Chlamydiales bacterium]|nr:GNAT family N-acetyltransferase [Chlamydiales bacterium]
MPQSTIKICKFTGSAIKTYLPGIARLRVEIFRDYPYLYEDDIHSETEYLRKYSNCKEAMVVIVFDGSEIVGASTGIPLEEESDEVKKVFTDRKIDPSPYYYFSESMLLKKYRGRGIGHHFFDVREAHVKSLQKYKQICFCTVLRPEQDTLKPDDYIPLDDFWKKRGYVKHPELTNPMGWLDIGTEKNSDKPMVFWVKTI